MLSRYKAALEAWARHVVDKQDGKNQRSGLA